MKIAGFELSFCLLESEKDNFYLSLTTDAGIMKVVFVKIKRMIFLVKVIRFNVIYLFLIEIFLLYYKLIWDILSKSSVLH